MLESFGKWASLILIAAAMPLQLGCKGSGGNQSVDDLKGDSCQTAIPMELSVFDAEQEGFTGPNGQIAVPDDADHYMVKVTEGEYYFIRTDSNPPENAVPPLLDPVISLYDETGTTLYATADDQFPRRSVDSEMFFRASFTGNLCVKVEDWSTWAGDTPQGDPSYEYVLIVAKAKDMAFVTLEDELDDEPGSPHAVVASPHAEEPEVFVGVICGTLADAQDEDVYSFDVAVNGKSMNIFTLPFGAGQRAPTPTQGHGSTLEAIIVDRLNSADEVAGSINTANGLISIDTPGEQDSAVSFRVRADAAMTSGVNDFYCLDYFLYNSTATPEQEVADHSNDSIDNAEPLQLSEGSVAIEGNIDPAGDIDYYSIDAVEGDTLGLHCWSQFNGSGLEDAHFAFLDPSGIELQSETESIPNRVFWTESQYGGSRPPINVTNPGKHYLVVSASGQSSEIIGSYYRCYIFNLDDQ